MLDHHEAAGLVRLRAALEHADRLAHDTTEYGRQIALVALDGVCEFAMWLAIHHRGLPAKPQADFHDGLRTLGGELNTKWATVGRAGVVQMHGARNQAQHAGALPDPALMEPWRAATGDFVRSLVTAAFEGQMLDEVLFASAVADERLRALIANAEHFLHAGDAVKSFDGAVEAWLAVRRRWRAQQHDAYGIMALHADFEEDPQFLDGGSRSTDYADVSVFTANLGEYHWLLATRRQYRHGVTPTTDDARRAILFVYHWILRWEAFTAGYPSDRWQAVYHALGPPTIEDDPRPQILWAETRPAEWHGSRGLYRVIVQLANIPERGRSSWGTDMAAAIGAALSGAGRRQGEITPGQRTLLGEVTFLVDIDVPGQTAATVIADAIDNATASYERRRQEESRQAERQQAVAAAFARVFAVDSSGVFGAVDARLQLRPDGEIFSIAVDVGRNVEELRAAVQIFSGQGHELAAASYADGRLTFDAFELEEEARERLEHAISAAAQQVQHVREVEQRQAVAWNAFSESMQQRLGAPPRTDNVHADAVNEGAPAESEQ